MSRATMNLTSARVVAPRLSHLSWLLLAVALAAGVGLPGVVASVLVLTLLTQAVIGGMLAVGVGFLIRQNGVVSFGHAAWYGVSAYCFGLLLRHEVLPAELALVLALAVPTPTAFLLGRGIGRVPGVAFPLRALAVGQGFPRFSVKAPGDARGDPGLPFRRRDPTS
ncbi:hypothetical protein GAY28_35400, partial [Azospirillum brasilense]|nr:hypothetical protein [Azospirillum brasilense]